MISFATYTAWMKNLGVKFCPHISLFTVKAWRPSQRQLWSLWAWWHRDRQGRLGLGRRQVWCPLLWCKTTAVSLYEPCWVTVQELRGSEQPRAAVLAMERSSSLLFKQCPESWNCVGVAWQQLIILTSRNSDWKGYFNPSSAVPSYQRPLFISSAS